MDIEDLRSTITSYEIDEVDDSFANIFFEHKNVKFSFMTHHRMRFNFLFGQSKSKGETLYLIGTHGSQ